MPTLQFAPPQINGSWGMPTLQIVPLHRSMIADDCPPYKSSPSTYPWKLRNTTLQIVPLHKSTLRNTTLQIAPLHKSMVAEEYHTIDCPPPQINDEEYHSTDCPYLLFLTSPSLPPPVTPLAVLDKSNNNKKSFTSYRT